MTQYPWNHIQPMATHSIPRLKIGPKIRLTQDPPNAVFREHQQMLAVAEDLKLLNAAYLKQLRKQKKSSSKNVIYKTLSVNKSKHPISKQTKPKRRRKKIINQ